MSKSLALAMNWAYQGGFGAWKPTLGLLAPAKENTMPMVSPPGESGAGYNNLCRHTKHQRFGACWLVGDGGVSSALRCMVVKTVLLCLPVCSGICASYSICSQKTNWAVLTLLCTDANAMDRSSVPWTLKRNFFGSLQWSRPFQYCNIQLLQEIKE